jgi:Kef-type K+ transport system membrane component KefB
MSRPTSLDYGTGRAISGAAIVALIIGLCCGPVTIGIAMILADYPPHLVGTAGEVLFVLAICPVASFAFSAYVFFRLNRPESPRGQYVALVGIIATLGWVIALIVYVLNYCELPFG